MKSMLFSKHPPTHYQIHHRTRANTPPTHRQNHHWTRSSFTHKNNLFIAKSQPDFTNQNHNSNPISKQSQNTHPPTIKITISTQSHNPFIQLHINTESASLVEAATAIQQLWLDKVRRRSGCQDLERSTTNKADLGVANS